MPTTPFRLDDCKVVSGDSDPSGTVSQVVTAVPHRPAPPVGRIIAHSTPSLCDNSPMTHVVEPYACPRSNTPSGSSAVATAPYHAYCSQSSRAAPRLVRDGPAAPARGPPSVPLDWRRGRSPHSQAGGGAPRSCLRRFHCHRWP